MVDKVDVVMTFEGLAELFRQRSHVHVVIAESERKKWLLLLSIDGAKRSFQVLLDTSPTVRFLYCREICIRALPCTTLYI